VLRGRVIPTFYEHDEQGRVVRSWQQPEWTAEDRALMLGRQTYEKSLCGRCGHPKERAWHPDNEGWFEVTEVIECHACTALAAHGHDHMSSPAQPVEYLVVSDTRDYVEKPLPPIVRPGVSDEAIGGAE
jgi:hypothetical protein